MSTDEPSRRGIKQSIRQTFARLFPNHFQKEIDPNRDLAGQMSWAGIDMAWVEREVKTKLPAADVFPMLMGSAMYGGYLDEFDEWRASARLYKARSFQGVVIKSNGLSTACFPLTNGGGDARPEWARI